MGGIVEMLTTIRLSDEWQTPQWLFDELNAEFDFTIDLCASRENRKCPLHLEDYLNTDVIALRNQSSFMNPPYSNPKPFIEKAWADSWYCRIVCLVKCDPSTRWWATFWNYDPHKHIVEIDGGRVWSSGKGGPKPGLT